MTTSRGALAADQESNHHLALTETVSIQDLACPILAIKMTDPVIAADGFTYQREGIEKWMENKSNPLSPKTNLPLKHKNLIENKAMKDFIQTLYPDDEGDLPEEISDEKLTSNIRLRWAIMTANAEQIAHYLKACTYVFNLEEIKTGYHTWPHKFTAALDALCANWHASQPSQSFSLNSEEECFLASLDSNTIFKLLEIGVMLSEKTADDILMRQRALDKSVLEINLSDAIKSEAWWQALSINTNHYERKDLGCFMRLKLYSELRSSIRSNQLTSLKMALHRGADMLLTSDILAQGLAKCLSVFSYLWREIVIDEAGRLKLLSAAKDASDFCAHLEDLVEHCFDNDSIHLVAKSLIQDEHVDAVLALYELVST